MKKLALTAIAMVLCLTALLAVGVQAEEDTIALRYDDRKDLSALIGGEVAEVAISDEVVTSCQVGTQTPDAHVLSYDETTGTLYAVGTGTATLTVNGTAYEVEVTAAQLSLFMYTGHSVGHGVSGTATQSVVIEAGQAYSSYDPHSLDVTQVEGYGLGYGSANRVGSEDSYAVGQGTAHIDAFSEAYDGTRGPGSGLAYRWNQLTGGKAWVINLAVGGSCLNEWQPGASGHSADYTDFYYTAVSRYSYAQTIIANEIAAGHYTLGHMGILYYCGANQKNYSDWTQESIEKGYEALWNSFKTDLAHDVDGDGEPDVPEFFGLVPYFTPTNLESVGFDKPAAFYMSSNEDYPDILMASDAYRFWMTEEGLQTFPEITYKTQSAAVSAPEAVSYSEETPNSIMAADGSHPRQVVYNAMGMDAAENIYAWLTNREETVTAFDLVHSDMTDVPQSITIRTGEPYQMLPIAKPSYVANLSYEVTGDAVLGYPLAVVGTQPGTATLTVKQGDTVLRTVDFTVVQGHDTHCVCGGTLTGTAAEHHTCDAGNIWVPLTKEITRYYPYAKSETETRVFYEVQVGGNYYLTEDTTWSGWIAVAPGQTVNICLNGHTLTTTYRSFRVNGTVNICDCAGGGQVHSQSTNGAPIAYLYNQGVMNIYGGTFTSADPVAREFAGSIGISSETLMTGYTAQRTGSTLNVYGGTLVGSQLVCTDGATSGGGRGGVVSVINSNCVFNLYGGTLRDGGTVDNTAGGGIIAASGEVNLYAGTISGSSDQLGAVYVGCDKVSLFGDVTFADNAVADFYVIDGKKLNIMTTPAVTLNAQTANTAVAQVENAVQAAKLTSGHASATQVLTSGDLVYLTEADDQTHKHCVCGDLGHMGDHTCGALQQWEPWTGTEIDGYYYLTGNIDLTKTVLISKGNTLNLCLNGYDIIGGTGVNRIFNIYGTLNLCDHKQADGSYNGDVISNYEGTNASTGRVFYVQNSASNGSGTFNMYGGNLKSNSSTKCGGIGGICYIMNMYGGTISGGTATVYGGNLRMEADSAVFSMYGGTISGGSAPMGENIQNPKTKAKVCLYGGQIMDGDVYCASDLTIGNVTCDSIRCVTEGMNIDLSGNCTANLSVEAAVYMDLNGCTLTGDASGEGTLYAYDSATDDYDSSDMGRITGTVTCSLPHNFKGAEDTIGSVKRYLTVADETGYSFHRFYLGITKLSLKPNTVGMGYKAVFAGSEQVKNCLKSYGYNLWVSEDKVVTKSMTAQQFVSLDEVTLRLNHVMSESNSLQRNLDNAELPINATVFMTLNGQTVTSTQQTCSLRQMVTTVYEKYESFTAAQQKDIRDLVSKYAQVVQTWGLEADHHVSEELATWDGQSTNDAYLLQADISISTLTVASGETLNICLNGYNITADSRAFNVYGTLQICDCKGTGSVSGGATVNGAAIHVYTGGIVDLESGTVTSTQTVESGGVIYVEGTLNMNGGILKGTTSTGNGANLYLKGGTVNLVAGTISGGSAGARGGNIYMNNGSFYMTGGAVSDGSAVTQGGNLFMSGGLFQMSSGTVSGGTAQSDGGNIYLYLGTFDMSGGVVTGGNAAGEGGNFRVGGSSKLQLSGTARVEKGVATKTGGNIQLYGTMTMGGEATVADGTAGTYGGNMSVFANAATATANFTMTGGTFAGGHANRAGNIRMQSNEGTVNALITGGTIEMGTANTQYPCMILANNYVNLTVGGNVKIAELFVYDGYLLQVSTEYPLCEGADVVIDKENDGVLAENVLTDVSEYFRFVSTDRQISYDAQAKTLVLSAVLQETMATYMSDLSDSAVSTGMTKADYAAIVAQCLAEYDRINPLTEVTVAGLQDELQAYSRILSSMAVLVDYGASQDITVFATDYNTTLFADYAQFKELFASMMLTGCEASVDYAGRDNLNFAVKEIVIAYYLTHGYFDEATVAGWDAYLTQIQPDTSFYTHADDASNRNAYLMGGEQLRLWLGLGDEQAVTSLIDTSLAAQLSHFDVNGMYRDNYGDADEHDPILYDLTTRVQLQLVLGFGYTGEYADELDAILKNGGMMTLFMTSANAELAYGGRSNQYLFNAALISANCEYEASRYAAAGDLQTAGAFKRNAHLAIGSIADYLAANKHVMNYYADSTIGTDSYGSYDKYMVTMSSFLSIAYLFADDTIAEAVTPAETGGYVIETSGYFDAVVATVGDYSIQILTDADDHYDSMGLGRIHKKGVYSSLGLSTPCTSSPAYTTPADVALTDLSLGAVWYVDGVRYSLAQMHSLSHELQVISESADKVEFILTYEGAELVGLQAVQEHYVLTKDGLTVTTKLIGAQTDGVQYVVPLLVSNGGVQTEYATTEKGFTVTLDGQNYQVVSDAQSISCQNTTYANRNGEYCMGILESTGDSITVSFSLSE